MSERKNNNLANIQLVTALYQLATSGNKRTRSVTVADLEILKKGQTADETKAKQLALKRKLKSRSSTLKHPQQPAYTRQQPGRRGNHHKIKNRRR